MGTSSSFDEFQKTVDADPAQISIARNRRDVFRQTLNRQPGVTVAWSSGSLRRGTQLKPIHDVDMVVEFDWAAHPDWGTPGTSSEEALSLVHDLVKAELGCPGGAVREWVRLVSPRDRAVKCFLDDPENTEAFTVDVMPVLRQANGTLLIPGKKGGLWTTANPEHLIRLVESRQAAWPYFRPLVRVLKQWRHSVTVTTEIKSLVMEVLALKCLPEQPASRAIGLRDFFTAAAVRVNESIDDPAGYCGPIQPDLDTIGLRAALEEARDLADEAVAVEANGNDGHARTLWKKVLGPGFPAPASATPKKTATLLTFPIADGPQG